MVIDHIGEMRDMKNDTISRKEAIDAIYKCTDIFVNNLPVMVDKDDAYKALAELQSVKPKTGKWIEAYDPFNRISGRCSVCGWEAHLYEDDVVGMNYCPNCGSYNGGSDD